MIRCKGRYSFVLVIIVFLLLFNSWKNISCTQNIFSYLLLSLCYLHVYYVAVSLTRPHKSSTLRDPTAQTTDGGTRSAEPPLFSPSGFTPHRVATACAQVLNLLTSFAGLLDQNYLQPFYVTDIILCPSYYSNVASKMAPILSSQMPEQILLCGGNHLHHHTSLLFQDEIITCGFVPFCSKAQAGVC